MVVGVAAGPIACCLLDYAALWVVCRLSCVLLLNSGGKVVWLGGDC